MVARAISLTELRECDRGWCADETKLDTHEKSRLFLCHLLPSVSFPHMHPLLFYAAYRLNELNPHRLFVTRKDHLWNGTTTRSFATHLCWFLTARSINLFLEFPRALICSFQRNSYGNFSPYMSAICSLMDSQLTELKQLRTPHVLHTICAVHSLCHCDHTQKV